MKTTGRRIEKLEQATEAADTCRLIIYVDAADCERQKAAALADGIEPGRMVCIPDNGRGDNDTPSTN